MSRVTTREAARIEAKALAGIKAAERKYAPFLSPERFEEVRQRAEQDMERRQNLRRDRQFLARREAARAQRQQRSPKEG